MSAFPNVSLKATTLPCGLEAVTTWVAIKLVDEDNKPIPRAKYIIYFPDGEMREDFLDDDGYAFFDGIPPGDCTVGFPEISPFSTLSNSLMSSRRMEELRSGNYTGLATGLLAPIMNPASIDIQLVDENKHGVPDEEYRLALPNGDVARGFLDAGGKAHIDGIEPGGDCQVAFPGVDKEFVTFVESK
jgi:hypothetical protein